MPRDTLAALFAAHPDASPAIGAPGRRDLTYGALRELALEVHTALRLAGIGHRDRVAIVLPNGPEMAAAYASIAQSAVTAPLNPAYTQEEFAFYLADLNARALVVAENYDGPAVPAAAGLGLCVLRLSHDPAAPAGHFTLTGPQADAAPPDLPQAPDVAMILHTSGTTSRPKIVPLTQANLCASARHIAASLALTPADRCLNVMPLFHIHGLVAAVTASLGAGASVWCAPGFDALRFFGWLTDARPTWYTAVPTMHQTILARAPRNADALSQARLRLIRSSSASLPPQVMRALGDTFGVPVIEAYGMTEAAHQMASNPLPPGAQKPGSVGIAAGPAIRIAHEAEDRLVAGIGEVVISGPNVTPGYEGNPQANATAFFEAEGHRWFRTGDQGALDGAGYLDLTGRLKEIINRGGEKISPLEVDAVLMDHPAVQQVVTFATPHPSLGEEVAAAVVLRDGQTADEAAIRAFAAARLAPFKVPRRIVLLAEIPKGATGKLQRIGLAAKLGLGGTLGPAEQLGPAEKLRSVEKPDTLEKSAPLEKPDPLGKAGSLEKPGPAGGYPMRLCIFGAGAIGGYLAARLALAGADVSVVARGPHLAAMQARGLTLIEAGQTHRVSLRATDDPAALGPQDYVILTLKAHSVPAVVGAVQPLLGPGTCIVSAANGVPWWYFYGLDGPLAGRRLASVDPGDVQWTGFGPQRMLGCVVYPAAEVPEPGVIRHLEGNRFLLGEPDGADTPRARALSDLLISAGLKAPVRPRIRDDLWVKLWGNLSFNPISALTGGTLEAICRDAGSRAVARAMMLEAQAVAEALGVRFAIDVDRRIAGAQAVGAHKTSMLQDLEAARPLETEALVAAVVELGGLVRIPTPTIETVLALVRLRAQAGLAG